MAEKSAEVQKLKDESKRRSAAFESISATSQAANDANEKVCTRTNAQSKLGSPYWTCISPNLLWMEQKLAALEDICRRKDISIAGLKQEIAALEMKVRNFHLSQLVTQDE